MIAFLRGRLAEALPGRALLDVGGVGYELLIPLSTFEKLPLPPAEATLHTVLSIRETEHVLYGFWTRPEKDLFTLLVNHVSGVGPKLALAVLNGSSPSSFRATVASRDIATLSKIKGLGKKTAERIVVELKDKMGISDEWPAAVSQSGASPAVQSTFNDAVLALISLGYKQADALKAIEMVGPRDSVEEIVRESLKKLAS